MDDGPPPEAAPPAAPPPLPENPSPSALRQALKGGRDADVVAALARLSPVRRAELFVQLRPSEQKSVLVAAPAELAASILADCDSGLLAESLPEIDPAAIAPAFALVPPDDLADIVLRLPEDLRKRILGLLDAPLREEVERLLAFDPETAGGMMTPRTLSVPDVVSVGRALELLRGGGRADGHSYIYIVDPNGRLAGVAPLRRLLMANPRALVRSVMVPDVVRLRSGARREEIVAVFDQYHFVSLPVVDDKDRLIGIVTFDDVREAVRRAEQAVLKGVTGADPLEPFRATFAAARGRIPWISVTILGGLGCAFVGGLFQRALAEVVVLGIFIPIVLAVGEAIGTQTTSVVLSAFAGGTVSKGGLARFLAKELLIGLLVGVYSGVVVSAVSLLWHGNPRIGLLIGASVFLSVAWAAFLGVSVPGLLRKLGLDPTVASGPVVLAVGDLTTLLVYFGGATVFLAALKA